MPPTESDILEALSEIDDPEMPISIVDLGIVQAIEIDSGTNCEQAAVEVVVTPTFVGCPALDMIRGLIAEKVGAMTGVGDVTVEFVNDPPWSVDRISDAGRERLAAHGVTVPDRSDACLSSQPRLAGASPTHESAAAPVTLRTSVIRCPFCDSSSTRLDSPFGPTRCRAIYYCEACRNSFEHMRRV